MGNAICTHVYKPDPKMTMNIPIMLLNVAGLPQI
jgi:hypothetical protein